MSQVNLSKEHPEAYAQLVSLNSAVEKAAQESGLDAKLIELVKIRVSQLNGCAFCLRMHTRDALALGETSDRLAVLAAWWESQYFSDAEMAALALAEEVTQLDAPVRETDHDALTPEQVSAVSWVAVVMNSWNRVAVRSGYPVAP